MEFRKKNNFGSIEEVIRHNTGMEPLAFITVESMPFLRNLVKVVNMIKEHNGPIAVVGDYDADGITSSYIMSKGLQDCGKAVKTFIPLRFSEGYGMNVAIIDRVAEFFQSQGYQPNDGMIVTVDNGIAAHEAVQKAKEMGMTVIVTDHHLPVRNEDGTINYPNADIILDPNAEDGYNQSDFKDYCGAGLAYRVMCELLPEDYDKKELLIIAGIGTVADVMPLIGANRWLVKESLRLVNLGFGPKSLKSIIRKSKLEHLVADDYGFKIGPIFNAASRLNDDGAQKVLDTLLMENDVFLEANTDALIQNNEKRKDITKKAIKAGEKLIDTRPIVIKFDELGDGIIGLVAGQACEKYHCPAIVFTKIPDGKLKGSGRSIPEIHLKDTLDVIASKGLIENYGGHAGAAGLTIREDAFDSFKAEFIKECEGKIPPVSDIIEYDLDIKPFQVRKAVEELDKYAPYGEGNPAPKFCLHLNVNQDNYNVLGTNHVKIIGEGINVMMFGEKDNFEQAWRESGSNKLAVIGNITENWYDGKCSYQILVEQYMFE